MFELHNIAYSQLPIQKICEMRTTLFKLTDTKEQEPILIKTKKELFVNTCLSTFLTGNKVHETNPQEAFEWAIKERDIYFH